MVLVHEAIARLPSVKQKSHMKHDMRTHYELERRTWRRACWRRAKLELAKAVKMVDEKQGGKMDTKEIVTPVC
jgi:hypothetical protein